MRLVRLRVSDTLLVQALLRGIRPCVVSKNPLPAYVDIIAAHVENWCVVLTLQSKEFAEVPEGGTPPMIDGPTYQSIDKWEREELTIGSLDIG